MINRYLRKSICFVLLLLLFSALAHSYLVEYRENIIPFTEHGTRRLIEYNGNRWFYYRSERNMNLKIEIPSGELLVRSIVSRDTNELAFAIEIDGVRRNYNVSRKGEFGDFSIMDDVSVHVPGQVSREMIILTRNRNAYFKVFHKEEIRPDFPLVRRIIPDNYIEQNILYSQDTESEYFSANIQQHLSFSIDEAYRDTKVVLWGFSRSILDNDILISPSFDVLFNGELVETVNIPTRRTGTYFLKNHTDINLSIGRRIDIVLPNRRGEIQIKPNTYNEMIFRLFLEIDEID